MLLKLNFISRTYYSNVIINIKYKIMMHITLKEFLT
jgi:hypothetical protein